MKKHTVAFAGLVIGLCLALASGVLAGDTVAAVQKAAPNAVSKGGSQQAKPVFKAEKLAPAGKEEVAVLRRASEAYGKKDYATAVSLLTPLAESGSARAAFSLGLMAMRGHGMPMSTDVAEKWWWQSAQKGFPDAQYHLGLMHHQGLRGPRDPEFIAQLWNLAAASGQGDAMFALGFMYRAGDGVNKDPKKSAAMFADAAKMGHPGAAYELGMLYKYGRGGMQKDAAKAKQYLQQAARAGMNEARQELAKK